MDFSPIDFRNYLGTANDTSDIPDVWEGKVPTPRQHNNAVATAATILLERYSGQEFSVDYFVGNKAFSKGEITLLECFKVAKKLGAVNKKDFPFSSIKEETAVELIEELGDSLYQNSYKIPHYCYLEEFKTIKKLIKLTDVPVVIMVDWYSDTQVRNGIIRSRKNGTYDMQPLLIYGWTERGWKVLNPNNPEWGEDGCAILPYHVPIYECWGIIPPELVTDNIFEIRKPYGSKIGNFFAKVLNKLGYLLGF